MLHGKQSIDKSKQDDKAEDLCSYCGYNIFTVPIASFLWINCRQHCMLCCDLADMAGTATTLTLMEDKGSSCSHLDPKIHSFFPSFQKSLSTSVLSTLPYQGSGKNLFHLFYHIHSYVALHLLRYFLREMITLNS